MPIDLMLTHGLNNFEEEKIRPISGAAAQIILESGDQRRYTWTEFSTAKGRYIGLSSAFFSNENSYAIALVPEADFLDMTGKELLHRVREAFSSNCL